MFGFRMFKLLNLFVLGFYFVNVQSGKELPIDLKCYIRSHNLTQCFWNPTTAPDSRFFYKFVSQDVDSPAPPPHVQECSSYMSINNLSTSCDLQRHYKHAIYINFTQNETVLKTFRILALADGLSPPPLKWTFTVSGNIAKIKWTAPDFGVDKNLFTFTLNYTHCGESKEVSQLTGQTYELKLDSRCQYCVVIKPVVRFYLKGETSWSDKKCFGTNITVDPPMCKSRFCFTHGQVVDPKNLDCCIKVNFDFTIFGRDRQCRRFWMMISSSSLGCCTSAMRTDDSVRTILDNSKFLDVTFLFRLGQNLYTRLPHNQDGGKCTETAYYFVNVSEK